MLEPQVSFPHGLWLVDHSEISSVFLEPTWIRGINAGDPTTGLLNRKLTWNSVYIGQGYFYKTMNPKKEFYHWKLIGNSVYVVQGYETHS